MIGSFPVKVIMNDQGYLEATESGDGDGAPPLPLCRCSEFLNEISIRVSDEDADTIAPHDGDWKLVDLG